MFHDIGRDEAKQDSNMLIFIPRVQIFIEKNQAFNLIYPN
jgi:hypothetical protein